MRPARAAPTTPVSSAPGPPRHETLSAEARRLGVPRRMVASMHLSIWLTVGRPPPPRTICRTVSRHVPQSIVQFPDRVLAVALFAHDPAGLRGHDSAWLGEDRLGVLRGRLPV